MPTFKSRAYFSVTSLVFNDVNVRECIVIQPSLKEPQYLSQVNIILVNIRKLNLKTMYVPFMVVSRFFKKVQRAFFTLLKYFFSIRMKIYTVYISVPFSKSVTR